MMGEMNKNPSICWRKFPHGELIEILGGKATELLHIVSEKGRPDNENEEDQICILQKECDGAGARSLGMDHPCLHVWVFMGITSMNRILWDSQRKDTPSKDYQWSPKRWKDFPTMERHYFWVITHSNLVQPLSRERQSCLLQAGDC